jgi:hypothetical protein
MTLDDEGNATSVPDASSTAANEPLPPFATKLTVTAGVELVVAEVEVEVVVEEVSEEDGGGEEGEVEATGVHCAYRVSLDVTSKD